MAVTLRDYYITGDDDIRGGSATTWYGQTFTPSENYLITSVKLLLYKVGDPGTITVRIRATTTGVPSGSDLTSGTTSGTSLTTNTAGEWREITLSTSIYLKNGITYAIIITSSLNPTPGVIWRVDASSPTYSGGSLVVSTDSGSAWAAETGKDFMFETWGADYIPTDKTYSKKLIAIAGAEVWYESSPGTMIELSAATGDVDTHLPLIAFEAYQKIFIANKTKLRVADFINTKIATADLGLNPPDRGNVLTGGTSGATMIVDYITSLADDVACTIYGYRTSSATFSSGETVTGTDDDSNAISFATSAAETAPPHWYNYTVYGGDTSFGALPDQATLGCNYRGRIVLAGDSDYPHQWYMSRQGNPWDWNYAATDAQSPVAANNADVGEVGDIITALIPYKDDYLVIGCAGSMWLLIGDPMEGGSLGELDLTTGIYGAYSWCFDGEGNLYFWGVNGIYVVAIPGGSPKCISEIRLPKLVEDEAVDDSTYRIVMQYDVRRAGILIFITKISDGSNSNYWYDLRTGGFFPESYPDECGVFSAFHYQATDPAYRKVLLGCNDGYIRFYDDSAKDDDKGATDQAINSYVKFGPIPTSQDPDKQGKLSGLNLITAGGGASGSQSDSDNVNFKVYAANSAAKVIEKLSANTNPNMAGTFKAPGRRPGARRKQKIKAPYVGIRLDNTTAAETWGFEKLTGTISPAGRIP